MKDTTRTKEKSRMQQFIKKRKHREREVCSQWGVATWNGFSGIR